MTRLRTAPATGHWTPAVHCSGASVPRLAPPPLQLNRVKSCISGYTHPLKLSSDWLTEACSVTGYSHCKQPLKDKKYSPWFDCGPLIIMAYHKTLVIWYCMSLIERICLVKWWPHGPIHKIVWNRWFGTGQQGEKRLWKWIIKTVQTQWQHKVLGGAGEQSVSRYSYIMMRKW